MGKGLLALTYRNLYPVKLKRNYSSNVSYRSPLSRMNDVEAKLARGEGRNTWKLNLDHLNAESGRPANHAKYSSLLKQCGIIQKFAAGKLVHAHIGKNALWWNRYLSNFVVEMYGKCSSLDQASRVFDRIPDRNIYSWTLMVSACIENQKHKQAVKLFSEMELEGVFPDMVSFLAILDSFNDVESLDDAKVIHERIKRSSLELNEVLGNSLINAYGRCGSLEDAHRTFDTMAEYSIVSWNTMLSVYGRHDLHKEALQMFRLMQDKSVMPDAVTFIITVDTCASPGAFGEGKWLHCHALARGFGDDVVLLNALLTMYGKCGQLPYARRLFDEMHERNVVSWSGMIAAYAQQGYGKEALMLVSQMQGEGVMPSKITCISILDACALEADIDEGEKVHSLILECGFEVDLTVGNALINMYGKCGSLKAARKVFDEMIEQDVITWNAMITSYAQHGNAEEALNLFQCMHVQKITQSKLTFVSILSAFSRAGMETEGFLSFVSASQEYLITPILEYYNCMAYLLGRAGWLVETEDMVDNMPFPSVAESWTTLLGACSVYSELDVANRAALHAIELDPDNITLYVLLSNMYSAAGRWDEAKSIRMLGYLNTDPYSALTQIISNNFIDIQTSRI